MTFDGIDSFDWGFAGEMVRRGAGGEGGAGFALYVVDTDGKLREFEYSNRAYYESIPLETKQQATDPNVPPVIESDGTTC